MENELRASSKPGLERFREKYPYWPRPHKEYEEGLGVGAPMVDPTRLHRYNLSQKSHNTQDLNTSTTR